MPNFKKHATTGAAVGLTLTAFVNYFKQQRRKELDPTYKFDWAEFSVKSIAGIGIGVFCGVLPDLIEISILYSGPGMSILVIHRKYINDPTLAGAIILNEACLI